jgi:hypothetical protein
MKTMLLFSIVLGACMLAQAVLAQTAPADLWTVPVPLAEVNTSAREWSPFLSYDGLTLYFARQDGAWWHIYEAKRDEPAGPFTSMQAVPGSLNDSGHSVVLEWVSPDNLRMYYTAINGTFALQVCERESVDSPWPRGKPILELNSLGRRLVLPRLTPDENTVIFSASDIRGGQGGYDLWIATRPDRKAPFGNVTNLSELNTPAEEHPGCMTPDGLAFYFSSNRDGNYALFRATRPATDNHFDPPVHLSLFDVSVCSMHPAVASDGSALYFVVQQGWDRNTQDIWVSYAGAGFPPDSPPPGPRVGPIFVGGTISRPGLAPDRPADRTGFTVWRPSIVDRPRPRVP